MTADGIKRLPRPALPALAGVALGAVGSAYMTFLRAPAVVDVRPGLADVGFVTALFSGRFEAWLWYHFPVLASVVVCVIFGLISAVVVRW